MPNDAEVARCASLADATRNSSQESATVGATPGGAYAANLPMTGRELRAQLKAQQGRNIPATRGASPPAKSCAFVTENSEGTVTPMVTDLDTQRRRTKALALLEANPEWRIAVVVEAGHQAIAGVAIRGVAYGELEIPVERYEAAALFALLERYCNEAVTTVH